MRYFLQRLLQFAIVFFLVTFGVMVFMRIGMNSPGDPARTMLGGTVSEAKIMEVNARYHLNSNYFVQYWYWVEKMFRGDFGVSVQQSTTVSKYLSGRVMVTIFLGFYAVLWALIIAIPTAVYQAYKRDSRFDRGGNFMSFLFVSLPALVLAPFIIFLFVVKLGWFPRTGEKVMPWDDLGAHFRNFFLPVVVLTLPLAAVFARLLRGDMIQTLQSDFITLASAKGVPPSRVLWTHALRNSLFSLLTSVGVQLGGLVGGALVVEQYFNMKGMGALLLTSILSRDLFVVQSVTAIVVAVVSVANLAIDLLYAVVDPRIRHARALT
ncbi:MAG: ABC transporter permease [Ilumatobacteraceae bacterium]